MKRNSPSLKIKTDNWGYFQLAFERVMDNGDSPWKEYDCFLAIILTDCVTGIFWVVLSLLGIYAHTKEWWSFFCKAFFLHFLNLGLFVGGNLYIFWRIQLFDEAYAQAFSDCNCSEFKTDFYRSITYYKIGTYVMAIVAAVHFIEIFAVFCKSRYVQSTEVVPDATQAVVNNENSNSAK